MCAPLCGPVKAIAKYSRSAIFCNGVELLCSDRRKGFACLVLTPKKTICRTFFLRFGGRGCCFPPAPCVPAAKGVFPWTPVAWLRLPCPSGSRAVAKAASGRWRLIWAWVYFNRSRRSRRRLSTWLGWGTPAQAASATWSPNFPSICTSHHGFRYLHTNMMRRCKNCCNGKLTSA